jgi:hypothetical protein
MSKYRPVYDRLTPNVGRTFCVECAAFKRRLFRRALQRWARRHQVALMIDMPSPRLTEQQALVYVRARLS